ncbi:hypothetical protein F0562_021298 [Nyssa sinensis]|uniref:Glycosyl hydrolase family 13 catalytic domain-containing protein n=1 Tax=Nyssa sinensis TaxID=561372 RepID=A0A5J5BN41_9ASTE|nr:hypothetical protein F0562_021298 [Nyssa sinensis]
MDMERKLAYGEFAKSCTRISSPIQGSKMLAISHTSVVQTEERPPTYLFRTEIGGQVKVFVRKEKNKYEVYVEFSSLQPLSSKEDKLVMNWGLFRSDSSQFMPLDFQSSASDARSRTIETPFVRKSSGKLAIELNFEASLAPFYLSFQLKSPLDGDSKSSVTRSHRNTNFCVPVGFGSGYPAPLGLSFLADGSVNLALFSRSAENVVLCLYDNTTADKPSLEIDLDPYVNRSGDIWHVSMDSALPFVRYGYRCKGHVQGQDDKLYEEHVLLDPYAKIIANSIPPAHHGSGLLIRYPGQLCKEPAFDWSGDVRPGLPMEKLVVYRLNVMQFTKDKSSKLANNVAGTFSGVSEKLHHFKDLGVNAILLEPIFPFDEQKGPYFPCHFFSPTNLYGPSGDPVSVINSMKEMVKRLHANGIEVFLEVVFTHTGEGGSLREVDNSSYYYANGDADLVNASYLLRGFHGEVLSRPPLIEAIAFDPLLSNAKIIADCWDPHDMTLKEIIFPHWKRWAEINAKFCNDVRNFLRGEGRLSNLATRLCGSGDIFLNGRGPAFSFNFIARNFGLPLVDLVSFSNSELASELSWNCGEEGATNKTRVLERRLKQIRNFLFILLVSLGVPVLNMGDECGQSSGGSPAYGDRKPFDWNALRTGFGIQTTQFISFLSSLRMRRSDLLQKRNFLKEENIDWHGSDQFPPKWEDPSSRFLTMTLKADKEESRLSSESSLLSGESSLLSGESSLLSGDLFIAFNAANHSESVILPPPPPEMAWLCLVDTALPFPGFFSEDGEPVLEQMAGFVTYKMKSHSCALFEARSLSS